MTGSSSMVELEERWSRHQMLEAARLSNRLRFIISPRKRNPHIYIHHKKENEREEKGQPRNEQKRRRMIESSPLTPSYKRFKMAETDDERAARFRRERDEELEEERVAR